MKKRIDWLDTMRGLALLMVMYAHNKPGDTVSKYLQLVLIPVFFFASGFFFDAGKYASHKDFFRKRVRRLVVPYFAFSFISLAFWVVFAGGFVSLNQEFQRGGYCILIFIPILGTFWGTAPLIPHNIPLWFLTALFSADQLFYWLRLKYKSNKKLITWMFVISFIGFILGRILPFRLPWNMDIALTIVVYYGLGHLFYKRWGAGWDLKLWQKIPLAAALFAISVVFVWINPEIHMMDNNIGRFFLFHPAALAAVGFFILFSQLIDRVPVIKWVGVNSLPILGLHVMAIGIFLPICKQVLGINVKETFHDPLWAVFYTAGTLLVVWPMVEIINRFFPQILGMPKRKKVVKAEPKPEGSPDDAS
ncbi:MAG TPA: acyltransferase [bacterium]|nr:acyltransferase [bacterium]